MSMNVQNIIIIIIELDLLIICIGNNNTRVLHAQQQQQQQRRPTATSTQKQYSWINPFTKGSWESNNSAKDIQDKARHGYKTI